MKKKTPPKQRAPKKASRPAKKPSASTKVPTVAQLEALYLQLKKTGSFRSACGGKAFFYEACWSEDAELERVFEDLCSRTQQALGHSYLPMDLYEEKLVNEGRIVELHSFFVALTPAQLARALAMMRTFIANPAKRPGRYESTQE